MSMMNDGDYISAIREAKEIMELEIPLVTLGSCHWIIACSLRDMGRPDEAISYFLESIVLLGEDNQNELLAHAQDELARTLYSLDKTQSSLFFISMAISNFESIKNYEMAKSCVEFQNTLLH